METIGIAPKLEPRAVTINNSQVPGGSVLSFPEVGVALGLVSRLGHKA